MGKERLDKLVASTGRFSRREIKALVREGRVLVDGAPASGAEMKVDPEQSAILLDGEPLGWSRFTYLMLHKPAGALSATEDRRQQTVLDLLEPDLQRRGLFPVGRLDRDTEGLLLLTNDGALAHDLLSPKKHVEKEYFVRLDGPVGEADAAAFREGVRLGELQCMPAELVICGNPREAFVTLHEGKFHQIKRMFQSRGRTVLYLKRLRMGSLSLDPDLPAGKYRHLTDQELTDLKGNSR